MQAKVIDLSHHNTVPVGFAETKNAGVLGVIHKATQGGGVKDEKYLARKSLAASVGLLWGAYHFLTASNVQDQVDNFLHVVKYDGKTLLAVDYEKNPEDNTTPQLATLKQFIRRVGASTGQAPVIYSGNSLKEALQSNFRFVTGVDPELASLRLWLADYGDAYTLPKGWSSFWLRQYTDQGTIAGVKSPVDLNEFLGRDAELTAQWVGGPAFPVTPVVKEIVLTVPKGTPYRVVEV